MIALNTKTETDEKTEIKLKLYVDETSLVLNKLVCVKCDICKTVCPKEAISVIRDEKEVRIDIDEKKCVLCEVCAHFCPVSAITLTHNNLPKSILLDNQGVLSFPKRIEIDTSRCPSLCCKNPEKEYQWCRRNDEAVDNTYEGCPRFCFSCVENCPRGLIKVEDESVKPNETRCLGCPHCQDNCEYGSITTTPVFSGEIGIDSKLCPEECTRCIDICPTEAISREGKEVVVNDRYCSFCGACVNICDKEAIDMKRTDVKAEEGEFSAAWSNAVEKLTG